MEETTTCLQCKKPLSEEQIKRAFKFCSKACAGVASRKHEVITKCQICGKELTSKQRWKGQKFCSLSCSSKREKPTLQKRVTLACLNCGKEFVVCEVEVRRNRRFCSHTCQHAYNFRDYDYPYDVNFFDTPNENNAYFLGMFITDGHLSKRKVMTLSLVDEQIINDIVKITRYTSEISKEQPTLPNRKLQYRLTYFGPLPKKLHEMGYAYGIKTGKEFMPEWITDELFPHCLRGIIDGDGSFFLETQYKSLVCKIACMNKDFLQHILDRLRELKIVTGGGIQPQRNIWSLSFKHKDAVSIGDFIYKNATIKLNRKYEVYLTGKSYVVQHTSQAGRPCSIEGCTGTCHTNNLCQRHYNSLISKKPERKEYMKKYLKEYYKDHMKLMKHRAMECKRRKREKKKQAEIAAILEPCKPPTE